MDFVLRFLQFLIKLVYFVIGSILSLVLPKKTNGIPPIRNRLLARPLVEIVRHMRTKQIKSQQIVELYIERIKEVNPFINAVVQDRFEDALCEAKRADDLIAKCTNISQLTQLYSRYPILGVPFTVKESCGVKGMSFEVGSLQRAGVKAQKNNFAVENLRSAGGIPLCVSANPEYCFSMETISHTNGKCLNPYDIRRTPGGSSGGEGSLHGSGSSLFGIASDIAGSIRIPSLFNGVFGHKPTGGLIPNAGVFPASDDEDCLQYLQTGPITRYGCDLSLILHIMAGENATKLDLETPVDTKQIKIFYLLSFTGINGFLHHDVTADIQMSILKAAKYFQTQGLSVQVAKINGFKNSTEIALSGIARLQSLPYVMGADADIKKLLIELAKSTFKASQYTKEALVFELLRRTNAFMTTSKLQLYKKEAEELKNEIIQLLGNDGVLFFPTFPVPAIHHHTSTLLQWAIDYVLLFNVLGLPSTHVPMGLNEQGLPVGFQVIAAPFKDKLTLQIAGALETAFGGWVPPVKHEFKKFTKTK